MFYLPQPAQNLLETLRGKQQGVAARQEHVLYLFTLRDVVQGGRKIERIFERRPTAAPPLPLAGTEPAMDGALVAHQPQDAIRISVDQVWNRRQGLFRERVLKTGRVRNLSRIRDRLFPDGVPGASDKPFEIGIQSEGILACNGFQGSGVDFPFLGKGVERKHEISE